jgi:hypothetical protein
LDMQSLVIRLQYNCYQRGYGENRRRFRSMDEPYNGRKLRH